MLVSVYGAKCSGIEALEVVVEINITQGIGIHLVGMADIAVKESLLRTTTALESLGFHIPGRKIIINLAPADMHKKGGGYDLPIAIGILAASAQGEFPNLDKYLIMGELGLDGSIREISGALPYAQMAKESGFKACIFPSVSAMEARDVDGIDVYAAENLEQVVSILSEKEDMSSLLVPRDPLGLEQKAQAPSYPDFSEIIGQESAKRGAEIAAAGGHNLIFIGPPGAGKSSMAKAMAGILPPLSKEEALLSGKIYSVAGKSSQKSGLLRERPFRAPHYSISMAAMIGGGGADGITPGEVSLAHSGILFLDEFGQIPKSVVEALRAPLEDRVVSVSRLRNKAEFPSSFMLVAASNPCPCGYWGDPSQSCTCTAGQRQSYLSKLSGPLLDRVDIQLWIRRVDSSLIFKKAEKRESSAEIAQRVKRAREIQEKRFASEPFCTNAEMNNKHLSIYCPLDRDCQQTMEKIMNGMNLSMRAYFRIIKVARTIADLEGAADIKPEHLIEAAGYRFLDKKDLL